MKMKELAKEVREWSAGLGLCEFSNAQTEMLKMLSQMGNLANAVVEMDYTGVKDSIGSVVIGLINYASMRTEFCRMPSFEEYESMPAPSSKDAAKLVFVLIHQITWLGLGDRISLGGEMYQLIGRLTQLALIFNLTLGECCEDAWREMKSHDYQVIIGGALVRMPAPVLE